MIFNKYAETMLYRNNVFHSVFFKHKHNLPGDIIETREKSTVGYTSILYLLMVQNIFVSGGLPGVSIVQPSWNQG